MEPAQTRKVIPMRPFRADVSYNPYVPEPLLSLTRAGWLEGMRHLWHEGQHIAIIGPTGSGKSTVGYQLMPLRTHVVVIAVKKDDETLDALRSRTETHLERRWGRVREIQRPRYEIISEWPPPDNRDHIILWDRPNRIGDAATQSARLYEALDGIYQAGHWTLFLDDANYLTNVLHLGDALTYLMNMGRSAGITCVVGANRPRKVPREAFTQVRFVLSFHMPDVRDADTIADIAGIDHARYRRMNTILGKSPHCFICTHKGRSVIVGR